MLHENIEPTFREGLTDNWYYIPPHTRLSLVNYFMHGLHPGGFIEAVLTNDLHRCVAIADHANIEALQIIVQWIQSHAPLDSWGTREKIEAWCDELSEDRKEFVRRVEEKEIWKALKNENTSTI